MISPEDVPQASQEPPGWKQTQITLWLGSDHVQVALPVTPSAINTAPSSEAAATNRPSGLWSNARALAMGSWIVVRSR